jgi:hypothetical protein
MSCLLHRRPGKQRPLLQAGGAATGCGPDAYLFSCEDLGSPSLWRKAMHRTANAGAPEQAADAVQASKKAPTHVKRSSPPALLCTLDSRANKGRIVAKQPGECNCLYLLQ